jgi:putative membrane protein
LRRGGACVFALDKDKFKTRRRHAKRPVFRLRGALRSRHANQLSLTKALRDPYPIEFAVLGIYLALGFIYVLAWSRVDYVENRNQD